MKIGHSLHYSQTLWPQMSRKKDSNLVFVDVAGMQDNAGIILDLINVFVLKKFIQRIHKVKFLIVLTLPQMEDSRGKSCRDLLETIRQMCQNKLQSMNGAIIPIITRVKASDDINL